MKMVLLSSSHTITHTLLQIIIILSLGVLSLSLRAQQITQPAQIAWGRYFDDTTAGSNFGREALETGSTIIATAFILLDARGVIPFIQLQLAKQYPIQMVMHLLQATIPYAIPIIGFVILGDLLLKNMLTVPLSIR
jgi:hypothetical protein